MQLKEIQDSHKEGIEEAKSILFWWEKSDTSDETYEEVLGRAISAYLSKQTKNKQS